MSRWKLPESKSVTDLVLEQALDYLRQSCKDMRALEKAGVIDKRVFQGFDHLLEAREAFLKSLSHDT